MERPCWPPACVWDAFNSEQNSAGRYTCVIDKAGGRKGTRVVRADGFRQCINCFYSENSRESEAGSSSVQREACKRTSVFTRMKSTDDLMIRPFAIQILGATYNCHCQFVPADVQGRSRTNELRLRMYLSPKYFLSSNPGSALCGVLYFESSITHVSWITAEFRSWNKSLRNAYLSMKTPLKRRHGSTSYVWPTEHPFYPNRLSMF